jgi:uncharacterized protein (DUF4415 family)
MKFNWDELKRKENLRKRKVDFAIAARIFEGQVLFEEDIRQDYSERRFRAALRDKPMSSLSRSETKSVTSSQRGRSARPAKKDTGPYSLDDLRRMHEHGETTPTPADAPTIELDDEFWRMAELLMPGEKPKTSVHLRLDHEVMDWFRSQGKGHLTRMNAVLRAYYEANRKKAS